MNVNVKLIYSCISQNYMKFRDLFFKYGINQAHEKKVLLHTYWTWTLYIYLSSKHKNVGILTLHLLFHSHSLRAWYITDVE